MSLTRKQFFTLSLVSVPLTALTACANAHTQEGEKSQDGKLKVVASFYPMADFAQKIAGDLADIQTLVPQGVEPHDWEPSTQDVRALEEADVFIYNGLGMETWAEDILAALTNTQLIKVEASQGVELIELDHAHEHEHEHEEGEEGEHHEHHHEGDFDPHVWLNPKNAQIELKNIADALKQADPKHADTFDSNLTSIQEKMAKLDQDYKDQLANTRTKTLVVSHEAFGYLCQAYGLEQIPIEGISADAEPDAQTMAEIIDLVKERGITTIFSEELVSPKIAEAIADATGAKVTLLNPLEGLSQADIDAGQDYISVMYTNLSKLVEALN